MGPLLTDKALVGFLQWALPRMGLRWSGFRKVRGQVRKRLRRRLKVLGLASLDDYTAYLQSNVQEWRTLDGMCRITISRFCRDRSAFEALKAQFLPTLASSVMSRQDSRLHCLSLGCAGGEEPYSLVLLWHFELSASFSDLALEIVATDDDPAMIRRARRACYSFGSLKELPTPWLDQAFERRGSEYCLLAPLKAGIRFVCEDVRRHVPSGPFDLVMCRNLAFTYFTDRLQTSTLALIADQIRPEGVLVLGTHEVLPGAQQSFDRVDAHLPIYRRRGECDAQSG